MYVKDRSAKSYIDGGKERLQKAYEKLPNGYFADKDAGRYLFNNIEALLSRLPASKTEDCLIKATEALSNTVSLYVGVPWCEKICSFCNLAYSTKSDHGARSRYLDYLKLEVKNFFEDAAPNVGSIYFGGGTPTFLPPDLLARHLSQVHDVVRVKANAGITCEFSTSTIDSQKLAIMREAGVNRVSTGVQSLDDPTRSRVNLVGSGAEAIAAVEQALEHFSNVNVDVIYGLPYQSDVDWLRTVLALASRNVPSITLYRLEVKERTTFKKAYSNNTESLADEGRARLQYFVAREVLESAGYTESPLGWWVKKATLSGSSTWLDYLAMWRNSTPYYGFGQGAFSVGSSFYWKNEAKREHWERKVRTGLIPAPFASVLPPVAIALNQLMRHVRTTKEVPVTVIEEEFYELGLMEGVRETIEESLKWGLMQQMERSIYLTESGESLVHWIFSALVDRVCVSIGLKPNHGS